MPGFRHVQLANCQARLSRLQAEAQELTANLATATAQATELRAAIQGNQNEQDRERERIAEIEREIRGRTGGFTA